MKNLSRQDRNGVRTAVDLERRYKFNDINYTKEEIERLKMEITTDDHLSNTSTNPVQNKVITQALNTKVNKETGKGLSSNDFTDADKEKLNNFTAPTKVSQLENDANYITQQAADIKYCTNESANEMNDSLETYAILMEKKVPTGGTTGQVLTKKSNTDNDTYWTTPTGGLEGGVTGDTLPIGAVVDYEGDTVPENWEEISTTNVAVAYLSNNYAIVTGGTYEQITFDKVDYIGNGLVLENGKIKVTKKANIRVTSKIQFTGDTIVTGGKNIVIRKNGTIITRDMYYQSEKINTSRTIISPIISVEKNDLIDLAFYGASNESVVKDKLFSFFEVQILD